MADKSKSPRGEGIASGGGAAARKAPTRPKIRGGGIARIFHCQPPRMSCPCKCLALVNRDQSRIVHKTPANTIQENADIAGEFSATAVLGGRARRNANRRFAKSRVGTSLEPSGATGGERHQSACPRNGAAEDRLSRLGAADLRINASPDVYAALGAVMEGARQDKDLFIGLRPTGAFGT